MTLLYTLIVSFSWAVLQVIALFHPKIALFVKGRRATFEVLKKAFSQDDRVIWVHAASLGEYEQGLPIMKQLKTEYPDHKLLLTFFSPSGYEVQKNTGAADVVTYLPMDTQKKVRRFLDVVRPQLALFIKYEIWPNYFAALEKRNIPIVLISAIFKRNQIYFKPYGGFMRRALSKVSHFFVQHEASRLLLNELGITSVTIAGDTRLDRVTEIVERNNELEFMANFKKDRLCFVAGSTWPQDENVLVPYINQQKHNLCYVLAPHNIKLEHIAQLRDSIDLPTVLYSEIGEKDISEFNVLIIDTIGLLTKIYSYADLAYVGGAFSTGLHNTLEPAVFGIPVIIGPDYKGFMEAEDLVHQGGILSIRGQEDFAKALGRLVLSSEQRKAMGAINAGYIHAHKGASIQIMGYLRTLL